MTLQPRRGDRTDIAGIFDDDDDGWPPRIGDKVSTNVDDGSELVEGYVLACDGENVHLLLPVGCWHGKTYDVRTRVVSLFELDRTMTTRARSNLGYKQANNLLLASIALPATAVRDWLRYVEMAVTLRKAAS